MIYPKLIIWWVVFLFNGVFISGETNFRNCKRVWGMSNSVNNIPMYSTGLYMCMEAPDETILALDDRSRAINDSKLYNKNTSNSTNSTIFTNSTKFLSNSTNLNLISHINKTLIKENITNRTNSYFFNNSISWISPSPSTTAPTTTTTTTTNAPITTTNTPPSPMHNIYNNTYKNQALNQTNNNLDDKKDTEMNPLLPTIIILSSFVGFCILSGVIYFCYKKGLCNKKKCSKTLPESQIEKVVDLENGEKNERKNTNSWNTVNTTLKTKAKLKELEKYKNSKTIKTKLKSLSKKQHRNNNNNKKNINNKPNIGGIKYIETKRIENKLIRTHLEEQSSRIPGGMNNPNLKRIMNRFPKSPRQNQIDSANLNASPEDQELYKKQPGNELTGNELTGNELTGNKDKYHNLPALPPGNPPPLLPDVVKGQVQNISRFVYGNKNNDNSPKMTIRELNPEEK